MGNHSVLRRGRSRADCAFLAGETVAASGAAVDGNIDRCSVADDGPEHIDSQSGHSSRAVRCVVPNGHIDNDD